MSILIDIYNMINFKINQEHMKEFKNKFIYLRVEKINKEYYLCYNLEKDSNIYKTIGLGSDNFINLKAFKKYVDEKINSLYDIEEAKQNKDIKI